MVFDTSFQSYQGSILTPFAQMQFANLNSFQSYQGSILTRSGNIDFFYINYCLLGCQKDQTLSSDRPLYRIDHFYKVLQSYSIHYQTKYWAAAIFYPLTESSNDITKLL